MCKKQLTTGMVHTGLENRSLVWEPHCMGLNNKHRKVHNMQLARFVTRKYYFED